MSTVDMDRDVRELLKKKFRHFRTENLRDIAPAEFENSLRSRIGRIDPVSEGYGPKELEQQRDLSVRFCWGHNHDFGRFSLAGRMQDRHLDLLGDFVGLFPVDLDSLIDKRVLDVGCWTGGTTLLLSGFAKSVVAIEEVKKYADTVAFLVRSFGLEAAVSARPLSVYECNTPEFHDRFNLVYFPGVIYHLSDPVLALRILYNSLAIGGEILVESAGINSDQPICQFEGNSITRSGNQDELNRGGWNWFLPSPPALERMMYEAGFREIRTVWSDRRNRVYGYGRKTRYVGICKAGLSVPGIL